MTIANIINQSIEDKGFQDVKDCAKKINVHYELLRKVTGEGHIPKDDKLMEYADKLAIDKGILLKTAHYQRAPDKAKKYLEFACSKTTSNNFNEITLSKSPAQYCTDRQVSLLKVEKKLDDTDLKRVVQYAKQLIKEKEDEEIIILLDALSENSIKRRGVVNLPIKDQVKAKQIFDTEYFRITKKIQEKTGLSAEEAFQKYIKNRKAA